MTPDQSLAWLAGLLEGEGYFGTIINRVAGRAYRYPRIGVNMTDADVIGRVASLWGVSVYVMRPAGLSKKTAYRTIILGSRAAIWMRQLYPFMGARRREQIDRALAEWEALPDANEPRREWSSIAARSRTRDGNGVFIPIADSDATI